MKRVVNLSALVVLSSTLSVSTAALACDGPKGKGGPGDMDANADGKVTQQEMLAAWTARFDAEDANKDGTVTPAERQAAHAAGMQARLSDMDTNKNGSIEKDEAQGPLARSFADVDADKNGSLSAAEIKAHHETFVKGRMHAREHDQPATKSELSAKVANVFKRLDNNGDGVLSGDELAHRGHGHHKGHGSDQEADG